MRRRCLIGVLVLGLTATAVHAPGYSRLRSSARSFRQHFTELKMGGGSLNTLERLVFSLVPTSSTKTVEVPPPSAMDRT